MVIKSILVVTDLSVHEGVAVQRACLLADTHRALLKLMYAPGRNDPPLPRASNRLANAARQLEEILELRVRTAREHATGVADVAREARGCDLVVMAWRVEPTLAALFAGQPVHRLLRRCSTPVLVARGAPQSLYKRILVATDATPASHVRARRAARLDPLAEVELFAGADGRRVPLPETQAGDDLLVVGLRRRSAWGDFAFGSSAHHALRRARGDVLVVPDDCVLATRGNAAARLMPPPGAAAGSRGA
jgi:nucleotide-binding universal stress UspA family protein